tara:strand:- start:470 stop:1252 length:783 start_codon:yes stop_codon:yes gene_type:complete
MDDVMASFGLEPEKQVVIPKPGITEKDGKRFAWHFNGATQDFEHVQVKKDDKTGFWYRTRTFDRTAVKQCLNNYIDIKPEGKVVLDLGANIGGFTRMALDGGATQVIAVEPCPYNRVMLEENAPKADVIFAGVVGLSDDTDIDYIYASSKSCSSVSSSTMKRRCSSDVSIKVPTVKFTDLLEKYRPQVLKCDIEGNEYAILDALEKIPDFVEVAFFEFHRGSEPFKSYPARYFPEDVWELTEYSTNRFGGLRELLFTRKG